MLRSAMEFKSSRPPSKWIEVLVEDKRATVPDQVAAKLDVGTWFGSLSQHMKQIAKDIWHWDFRPARWRRSMV